MKIPNLHGYYIIEFESLLAGKLKQFNELQIYTACFGSNFSCAVDSFIAFNYCIFGMQVLPIAHFDVMKFAIELPKRFVVFVVTDETIRSVTYKCLDTFNGFPFSKDGSDIIQWFQFSSIKSVSSSQIDS